ncbi:hypothetical protein ABW11_06215 [Pluralibacter gergoviae]|uniref:hypothetical protein n=1 Tax=Pluralibacter gergoviae TaxID=61647 RepID=UPI0006515401|nr:hypothetical protein [Pluralibacter gergoviae]KMK28955.1 hypothetical protein ABW11_06215 [Pluralibacter gergoviae]
MSLIKDILIYVDDGSIDDFTTVAERENLQLNKVLSYSTGGPETFAICAESISPYLTKVIAIVKNLVRLHKKTVSFELEAKDGSVIRSTVDGYSKDEAIEILNEAVRLSMKVSEDGRK